MRKIVMTMSAVLIATATFGQRKWTLAECIDYALANNITLKKQRLSEQSALEDVKGAKADLFPSLSFSTNQSVGYRPWQDNGVTTVTNGQVNAKVDKSYYNGSYGLNAQWTVWNGNKNVNTIKLNQVTAQQAELSTAETANSIQEKIAQLYIQTVYLTEAIKVSESNLETSRKNEQRGQEMVNVGKMSRADLSQLSAQRATDEYNIVEAESQVKNYKLQLKQLLEITDTEDFEIATPPATDADALEEIPTLASVYSAALETRPEIENSKLALEGSKLQMSIAKAGRMPSINVTGGLGTSSNSLSNNGWGNQLKTNFDASAGLSLSVPLLDKRQTRTAVNKAQLQRDSYLLDLQDKEKQLYQTIEGYWLDATTSQQKFKAATMTVNSEQESFSLLQEQFQLGLKNIIELMTGKDKLLSAQQSQLQAKYTTILNLQMLKFYSGQQMK